MATKIEKRDALIMEWKEAQKTLEAAKNCEMELRNTVVAEVFNEHEDEGTENVELGNGYKLKASFKMNRTLDNKDDKVDKVLEKMEKLGAEGTFIADRLIKWEPKLSLTEYRNLDDKYRKIIDEVITTKSATPSLELIEPKLK